MEQHLFVYGTLMTRADGARLGKSMRARLQRESEYLGAATMPGRLFDLGRYPGLVAATKADEWICGEVVRLADAARSLRWLDAYEGVRPNDATSLYERALRTVQLATGDKIDAWVYLYRGDVSRARHLPDGRWSPQSSPAGAADAHGTRRRQPE